MSWDDSLILYDEKIKTQDAELMTGKRQQGKVSTSNPKSSSTMAKGGGVFWDLSSSSLPTLFPET